MQCSFFWVKRLKHPTFSEKMIIKQKTVKKLACTIKISMYKSVVFLSFFKINSKFHNFQLNVTIHRCLRNIFLFSLFSFFWEGGDGNKFYAIFKHIFIVFLECDPLACNREVFLWNRSRNSRKRIPFWQDVSFFVSLYVTWILSISDILPFQKKFRGKSLKISIINFFHLPSFPSFSCKVVLPISLENPKDT